MGLGDSNPGPHACTEAISLTEHLLGPINQLSKQLILNSRMRRCTQCGHTGKRHTETSDPSGSSWDPDVRFRFRYQARGCIAEQSWPHSSPLGSSLSLEIVKTMCHVFLGDRLPLCLAQGFSLFLPTAWDSRRNSNLFQ